MSNKIDTSNVSDPLIAQPFTSNSLAFLQSGTSEIVSATIGSLIGYDTLTATTPYILYGCSKTDLGSSNYSFEEGYMFYNNEVFYFPSITSINIPDTAVCTIVSSADAVADPLLFTDGINRSVHIHRTLQLTNGLINSGDFNYNDASKIKRKLKFTSNAVNTAATYSSSVTYDYITTPNDKPRNWKVTCAIGYTQVFGNTMSSTDQLIGLFVTKLASYGSFSGLTDNQVDFNMQYSYCGDYFIDGITHKKDIVMTKQFNNVAAGDTFQLFVEDISSKDGIVLYNVFYEIEEVI